MTRTPPDPEQEAAEMRAVALRDGSHLGRLLLGEPEHRAGAATEPGVRRLLRLARELAGLGERGLEVADA